VIIRDLSSSHPKIHETLFNLFSSPSEEIKLASAFALGNIALGNLPKYMPIVISTVREGGKRQYLVLRSIKEIISRSGLSSTSRTALMPFAADLWTLLFANAEQSVEESIRVMIAECLGKLSLSDPEKYLKELVARLTSPSAHVRATVVAAIRYTFTDSLSSDSFDSFLRPSILKFMMLINDSDLVCFLLYVMMYKESVMFSYCFRVYDKSP
jgi:hypothetical protein